MKKKEKDIKELMKKLKKTPDNVGQKLTDQEEKKIKAFK